MRPQAPDAPKDWTDKLADLIPWAVCLGSVIVVAWLIVTAAYQAQALVH